MEPRVSPLGGATRFSTWRSHCLLAIKVLFSLIAVARKKAVHSGGIQRTKEDPSLASEIGSQLLVTSSSSRLQTKSAGSPRVRRFSLGHQPVLRLNPTLAPTAEETVLQELCLSPRPANKIRHSIDNRINQLLI